MIDLYSAATMNGRRAAIALAECGLAHRLHLMNLEIGEHRTAAFLELNPSGMIPVLVDDVADGTPVTVAQSGAILLYCAEISGRLIPTDPVRRRMAFAWFAQATTDVGPASSAMFQLTIPPERSAANTAFFEQRFLRHCAHVDRQLAGRDYLADEFSIADVALFPIIAVRGARIDATPDLANLNNWRSRMAGRQAPREALASHG